MKQLVHILLTCNLLATALPAAEKLDRGKDRIGTPAVGSGLCVHNLLQSNLVVRREKPIPIWDCAAPSEIITVIFGD